MRQSTLKTDTDHVDKKTSGGAVHLGFDKKLAFFCRHFLSLTTLALLIGTFACQQKVAGTACTDDLECDEGFFCENRECIELVDLPELGCDDDLECDVNNGFQCVDGQCEQRGPVTCVTTASCPFDQYCNSQSSTCVELLEGWCRQDDQCASGLCSSAGAVPGRCVQCRNDGHCDNGATCNLNNICEGGETPPADCGANATRVNDACVCNTNYVEDAAGNCVMVNDVGLECPPNASVVNGSCACDEGFEAGPDENSCVVIDVPNQNPPNDPPEDPPETDWCEEFGWYNDGECDTICANPDPDCEPPPVQNECTANSECWANNPNEQCVSGACVCDVGFLNSNCSGIVNEDTCSCEAVDQSLPALNESCVTESAEVLDCRAGLECVWETDSFGDPLFGSCKRMCDNNDNDCAGSDRCVDNFIQSGLGICGTAFDVGETGCGGSWTRSDDFCFEGFHRPSGDAIVTCIEGRCERVCGIGNEPGVLSCPLSDSCGNPEDVQGFNEPVSMCE